MNDLSLSRRHGGFADEFYRFLATRELRYPTCSRCGKALAYNERLCVRHPRAAISWHQASGQGHVHAMVDYQISYAIAIAAPYRVAVIELAEGPRLTSTVIGAMSPVKINSAVHAVFDENNRLVFEFETDQVNGGSSKT